MIDFIKNFFAGEKAPKQRDVMVLDAYAMDDEEETQSGGCCGGGCSSGGCGSCGSSGGGCGCG